MTQVYELLVPCLPKTKTTVIAGQWLRQVLLQFYQKRHLTRIDIKTFNALFLIAEGGIGLRILVAGRLVREMRELTGEIGHWKVLPHADDVCNCGARGCLEPIASSPNIIRQYVEAE